MAKILITTIGTGDNFKDSSGEYKKTNYQIDNHLYENRVLVADALIDHHKFDKVFFIGTCKSIWDYIYYHYMSLDDEASIGAYEKLLEQRKSEAGVRDEMLFTIEQIIDNKLQSNGSKCFLLEYSKKDHEELQKNFMALLQIKEFIDENDEIYLDITHGFRYIPILNILLVQFLLIYTNNSFKVPAIYYGMLSSPISEVINFREFFDLIEWANAISAFKKRLDADALIDVMSANKVEDEVKKVFRQINSNIQLANLGSLWQFFKSAKNKIERIKNTKLPLLSFLHEDLIKLVDRLNVDKLSLFQFEIAKWFYENHQYALSYLALHEAIITKFCELKFPDKNCEDKELRGTVKIKHIDYPYDEYFLEKRNTKSPNLDSITNIRNSIAHQLNDRKDKVNQDIDRLKVFIEYYQPLFYEADKSNK
ncbi:MAG: TIGR02221 family CRISPR-associated protein [Campylobacteraceae bacterium]|nr:TIGR02221 family CRISPR-associated protein [Campylobacteraceae bacterium]